MEAAKLAIVHLLYEDKEKMLEVQRELTLPDLFVLIDLELSELRYTNYLVTCVDTSGVVQYLLTQTQFHVLQTTLSPPWRLRIIRTDLTPALLSSLGKRAEESWTGLWNGVFDVIVVGSGLAGLSAALTIAKAHSKLAILMLEQEKTTGGNSKKASSGISGISTPAQTAAQVQDSLDCFIADTLASGKGRSDPKLVSVLAQDAVNAWNFLTVDCNVDLSLLTCCGGHSVPRTHRPQGPSNVGFNLVAALSTQLEAHKNVRLQTRSQVKALLYSEKPAAVHGVVVAYDGDVMFRCKAKAMIIATGGYANDHTTDSLLKQHVPHLERFPTTNGPFAQGSGIKIAQKVGALTVDLDQVQIHPTGFVDPHNPEDPTKILAPEMLRGVGGILLTKKGNRFCNELGLRDYITNEILKNCPDSKAILLLPARGSQRIGPAFGFYLGRQLIERFPSLAAFSAHYHLDPLIVQNTLIDYARASQQLVGTSQRFGNIDIIVALLLMIMCSSQPALVLQFTITLVATSIVFTLTYILNT